MQQSVAGTNSSTRGDIRIISGSNRLFYSFPSKPAVAPQWSSYSLPLNETGDWHWGSLLGPIATRNQIISVLSNITAIEINGTYVTNAAYTSAIDNVVLEQGLGSCPYCHFTQFSSLWKARLLHHDSGARFWVNCC